MRQDEKELIIISTRSVLTFEVTLSYVYSFIVKKDAPGLIATKIENKIGLRIVQNGDVLLKKVFVPDEDRVPGFNSFQDTNTVSLF